MTLPLHERIVWLHSEHGPHGWMSHDTFARRLGTSRQTVISWEKPGGTEPRKFADALAEFSGFPREAFLIREGSELLAATMGARLRLLEVRYERLRDQVKQGFELLDLQVELSDDGAPGQVRRAPGRKRPR